MKIKFKLFIRSFLLSFVIFALVSGIIMARLYLDIVSVDPETKESTVLVGVLHKEKIHSLMVLNLDPNGNCISFLPIPDNTLIPDNNASSDIKTSVQSLYEKYGISSLKKAVEGLVGTKVDRYILFPTSAISKLTDSVGAVNCYIYNPFVHKSTYYSGQYSLNGDLAEAMFTYHGYDMTRVSLSGIGRAYLEAFLSDHAKPQTVGMIASTINSDAFKDLIKTDLSKKEVEAYCTFLAKYELLSHRFIELKGFSTTAYSSIYFTPEITNSTQNIFK